MADISVINPFDFFLDPEALEYPFPYPDWLAAQLQPFRATLPIGEKLVEFLAQIPCGPKATVGFLSRREPPRPRARSPA